MDVPVRRVLALGVAALVVTTGAQPADSPAAGDSSPPANPAVTATAMTPALYDDDAGGNANGDDPAIWLHPTDPAASLVVATAKEGGLYVYDLGGAEVQHIASPEAPTDDDAPGRLNNVDLAYGFPLGDRTVDLAVVSDRGRDRIRSYLIDPAATGDPLSDVTAADAPLVFNADEAAVNDQETAYGLAVWQTDGSTFAFASQRHRTGIAMLQLEDAGGTVSYTPISELTLPDSWTLSDGTEWTPCEDPGELPQVEGMVVDQRAGVLYAAQEDVGVWRIPVTPTGFGEPELFERTREFGVPGTFDEAEEECVLDMGADPGDGGEHLAADAEGLTIYYASPDDSYLLASGQGANSFSVFQLAGDNAYIGTFEVVDGDAADGVQHSDGSMVLNVPLGPDYPEGILVLHDGDVPPEELDAEGEAREKTGFKYVPWPAVANAFETPLTVDTQTWSPRQ